MTKIFNTEFQVRGYELDGYGHVNHAVYLNYGEYARWCMIEEAAGSDYFKRNNIFPVIVRSEVDYKAPCYLAEWLRVETQLLDFRKRVARFRQRIYKRETGEFAAELVITMVSVNSQGKTVSIPADFTKLFGEPLLSASVHSQADQQK